jgi:hypothetical protein
MENIIDRVINEIVWRLTYSRKGTRASEASELSHSQQAAPSPQQAASPPQAAQSAFAADTAPVAEPPMAETTEQADDRIESEAAETFLARKLQLVVAEARVELDGAVELVAQLRTSADGFSQRIAAMGERLDELGSGLNAHDPVPNLAHPQPVPAADVAAGFAPPMAQAPPEQPAAMAPPPPPAPAPPPPAPLTQQAPQAPPSFPDPSPYEAEQVAANPSRTLSLTISSLSNLTVVSVVEAALLRIVGVREVALRQLQGRQAVLEVRLDDGTELISGLRKSLPIAFDVTESSDHSLGISLSYSEAHSQVTNGGGGAGTTLA